MNKKLNCVTKANQNTQNTTNKTSQKTKSSKSKKVIWSPGYTAMVALASVLGFFAVFYTVAGLIGIYFS